MKKNLRVCIFSILAASAPPAVITTLCCLPISYSNERLKELSELGPPTEMRLDYSGLVSVFFLSFFLSAIQALALGLPAFLALKHFRKLNWLNSLIAGFFVGSIPLTFRILSHTVFHSGSLVIQNVGRHIFFDGLYGALSGYAAWLTWSSLMKIGPQSKKRRQHT
jgi:hypothetical protein